MLVSEKRKNVEVLSNTDFELLSGVYVQPSFIKVTFKTRLLSRLKILLLPFRRHWGDCDGLVERVRRGQLPLHVDGHVHENRDVIGRRSHREEVASKHGNGRHQEETCRSS